MGMKRFHIVLLLVLNTFLSVQAGVGGMLRVQACALPGMVSGRLHAAPLSATGPSLSLTRQSIRKFHIKVRFLGGCCGFIAGFQPICRTIVFPVNVAFVIPQSASCSSECLNLHPLRGPPEGAFSC